MKIINLLQSCKNTFKALVIVLTTCLFFFSPVAIASTDNMFDVMYKEVPVENGEFAVARRNSIPHPITIEEAIVSLPEGESGTIKYIEIIGPNRDLEFGCGPIEVVNKMNLLESCGTESLKLEEGATTYQAAGSNFQPDPNTTLKIALKP